MSIALADRATVVSDDEWIVFDAPVQSNPTVWFAVDEEYLNEVEFAPYDGGDDW